MSTALHILIRFCNEKENISRKEITKHFHDTYMYAIDNYRNHLCLAGYLQKVELGKYKRLKEIPITLTSTQLLYQAYPHKYFHKLAPKRIILIEKYKKSNLRTGY